MTVTEADLETPEYLRLKKQLASVRTINPKCLGTCLDNLGRPGFDPVPIFFTLDWLYRVDYDVRYK